MYTEEQLYEFGKYLLSEERENRIADNYLKGDKVPFSERKREVYHADVMNAFDDDTRPATSDVTLNKDGIQWGGDNT